MILITTSSLQIPTIYTIKSVTEEKPPSLELLGFSINCSELQSFAL